MGTGRTVAAVVGSSVTVLVVAGFLLGFLPWPTPVSGPGPVTPTTPAPSGALQLQISIARDPVVRGNLQTMTVQVTAGGVAVEGVSVSATVTDASGVQQDLVGVTNENGVYNFTWIIGPGSNPGTFTVIVVAQKAGYPKGQGTVSFVVTAAGG